MGRPPSNGGPSFRFNPAEIAEMEAILQAHKTAMPAREVLVNLAEKFSNSEERKGKIEVQMKQVWNWFQNRRYAIRAKAGKLPGKLNITHQMPQNDPTMAKGIPQPTLPHAASAATVRFMPQSQHPTVPSGAVRTFPQPPQNTMSFSGQSGGRVSDNSQMEYEAKSARDGAWYDVSTFLSHRSIDTGDPEVMVRFAGFGPEEDEWVNVRKNVRQRSLPCEASECVAVLPADLILCFQEGKEQALYFDAHVLDAQRRRHDVRGCRCRFLVRYDHDQSEEIVALRKICRRPETDYRLQQLHAVNESKNNNIHTVSTLRVYPPADVHPKQPAVGPPPGEAPPKRQKVELTVPAPTVVPAQPSDDVPQDEQNAPSVKMEAAGVTVTAPPNEVPPELHKVQPVVPDGDQPQEAGPASEPPQEGKIEVVDVQAELPQVQSAKAVESKLEVPRVQPEAVETKDEVQAELPKVQPETNVEVPLEVQPPSAIEASETKAEEVPPELPQVQPASAVDMKAEVQTELPQVQLASESEIKAEVPVELPQVQPETASLVEPNPIESKVEEVPTELLQVQPATSTNVAEAMETKAQEVPMEVQPLSASVVETKAEVQPELPQVQSATAVMETEAASASALEAKDDVPAELPQVQVENASTETKDEVPQEMPQGQPANALIQTETEQPVAEEEAMKVEDESEQPKVSEIMETDDNDMEQV